MSITAPKYWRQNKNWAKWLGRVGKVVVSTQLQVSPPVQKTFLPYSFVLVDFGREKKELMGIPGEVFETGDEVICVFRKLDIPDEKGIINYGIKVKKVTIDWGVTAEVFNLSCIVKRLYLHDSHSLFRLI